MEDLGILTPAEVEYFEDFYSYTFDSLFTYLLTLDDQAAIEFFPSLDKLYANSFTAINNSFGSSFKITS